MSEAVELTTSARSALRAELRADPRLMSYLKTLKYLPNTGRAHRVLFASSYTVRTLDPYLRVEAELAGWRIEPNFVEYAQWQQALIAGSSDGEPDAYVLMIHPESLLSGPNDGAALIDAAESSIAAVLRSFRARSMAPLFVLHLPPPRPHITTGPGADRVPRHGDPSVELSNRIAALAKGLEATHVIDLSAAPRLVDSWHDDKGFETSLSPIANHAAPLIAESIARKIAPLFRPRRKVLVLDLDNTLWGGVVGEVGSEGIELGGHWPGSAYVAFQRAVHDLGKSGVLLAINSKNNEADVRAVFDSRPEMVLQWNDFVARRINWRDKAENLASIANELSLGIESFVFIDDSPVECARIRSAFREVEVVQVPDDPSQLVDALLNCPSFDALSLTEEDRLRTESYQSEAARGALRETTGDLSAFLRSLSLEIDIARCDDKMFERLHQLLLKTNQFHVTLERPVQSDLARRRERLFSIRLRDRFGDYGIIGVLEIAARHEAIEIINLALSCRALGRLVEESILAFAIEMARAANLPAIVTRAVVGPRNRPALDFLEKSGFAPHGAMLWLAVSRSGPLYPIEAKVNRPEPAIMERT